MAQTIGMAQGMAGKEMLTRVQALEIRDNRGALHKAFRDALKPGEWAHIRDPNSEKMLQPAYLALFGDVGRLLVVGYDVPCNASHVVILKETCSEVAAQKPDNPDTKLALLIRETLPPIIASLKPVADKETLRKLRDLLRAASE